MNETTQILKVDEAGRVRTPRERQEAALNEFERTGTTEMQFARHVGVKYPTLMNWVQRSKGTELVRLPNAGNGLKPWWRKEIYETIRKTDEQKQSVLSGPDL